MNEYHYEFNIVLYTLRHPKAHDAGICCMRLEKDHENNQWWGSLKIWLVIMRLTVYTIQYTKTFSTKRQSLLEWFLSAHLGPLICLNFFLRLMTGSFDKTVKIWSIDGKFTHKLDNFLATISGICYVPRNKTVWVAGGTSYASLFDPKSGDNVSW